MQSNYKLAEAGLVSLKSQTEVCNSQLCEVQNRLSSRRADLEQLVITLAETPVQADKLWNKVSC